MFNDPKDQKVDMSKFMYGKAPPFPSSRTPIQTVYVINTVQIENTIYNTNTKHQK